MRKARAGQLLGLIPILTPVFGLDTLRMGDGVGGWDWVIWEDFSNGLAPFLLGIRTGPFASPIVPRFAQSHAFQGYEVRLCVF